MKSFEYFQERVQDWKATSYGDVGLSAGYGGGLKHLKLWSPSKNLKVNSLVLQATAGYEIEITSDLLTTINGVIQNLLKTKDAATAESSYKKLNCYRAFSIADYIGSTCAGSDQSFIPGSGIKVGTFVVYQSGVGLLFSIPPEVEGTWGLGGAMTGFVGTIIGVGTQFFDYNMQQRFMREKARKPTDPVIRDPGGF